MCTETIEQETYLAPPRADPAQSCAAVLANKRLGRRLESDRLRLDVGVSRSGEMYSWAAENRFSDSRPAEIVGEGPCRAEALPICSP